MDTSYESSPLPCEGGQYNSSRPPDTGEPIGEGRIILQSNVVESRKGAVRRCEFAVRQISILWYTSRPEFVSKIYDQRDELLGRGVVIIYSNGSDSKCFLTFSLHQ
jgi:hypothetical protein